MGEMLLYMGGGLSNMSNDHLKERSAVELIANFTDIRLCISCIATLLQPSPFVTKTPPLNT